MLDGIFLLIVRYLYGREAKIMAMAYATLIIKGKKSFADVPDRLKEQVREILIDLDCGFLVEG
jgi:hypothetical protein